MLLLTVVYLSTYHSKNLSLNYLPLLMIQARLLVRFPMCFLTITGTLTAWIRAYPDKKPLNPIKASVSEIYNSCGNGHGAGCGVGVRVECWFSGVMNCSVKIAECFGVGSILDKKVSVFHFLAEQKIINFLVFFEIFSENAV